MTRILVHTLQMTHILVHTPVSTQLYLHLTLKLVLVSFSEMIDGCRAFLAIANVTTPYVFDNLLKSMRYFNCLFDFL